MQRSTWARFTGKLGKWRLLFLIFLAIYLSFLLLNLGGMTIQWDEANHLEGGLLLIHGQLHSYVATGMFYPPLDDLILAGYFAAAGPSVFVGRLIAVTFAALSVLALFEFAYRTYGPRTAFVSGIFLATMPGFVWLARVTMLETTLIFFFSVSMMLFFFWLQKHQQKFLLLSGVALGLGFLAKYQAIVAVAAMLASVFLVVGRDFLKKKLTRFPLLILMVAIIVLPWIIVAYQTYSTGTLDQWLYAMNMGNPQKSIYSLRFPTPIFYLIEMVWPYGVLHPVSLFIYGFGLVGLGFFAWRRKPEDKFLLIWFATAYVFFSLLGNRQWRYMVPVLPVFAVSAASLVVFVFGKAEKTLRQKSISLKRARLVKVGAAVLIAVSVFAVAYSCADAYVWVQKDAAFNLPLDQASKYVAQRLGSNESLVILCPINVFSSDITRFYVHAAANQGTQTDLWQYPATPVDTYTPTFNVGDLASLCKVRNARYLLLYEYGETYPYYNSNLTMQAVYNELLSSQQFSLQTTFGSYPSKIFVISFAQSPV